MQLRIRHLRPLLLPLAALVLLLGCGCSAERRQSDAELGLTPQQATGRHLFDANCARCHEPYSRRGLHGPSLRALFRREFLPSGQPANEERVTAVVRGGRSQMPAFTPSSLSDEQLAALLAYLKTL